MKKKKIILTVFLFVTINTVAWAESKSFNIEVWPEGSFNLRRNPIFILSYLDLDGSFTKGLNTKYKIYLKSGKEIIPLKIVKVINSYSLVQVLAKPQRLLRRGENYHMMVENLPSYLSQSMHTNLNWKVGRSIDHEKPEWIKNPIYSGNEELRIWEGSDDEARFCLCIKDKSVVYTFIKKRYLSTGYKREFIVPFDGPSQGIKDVVPPPPYPNDYPQTAFKEKCEVSFLLMDASGNFSESWTKPVVFDSQFPNGKTNLEPCDCPPQPKPETEEGEIVLLSFSSVFLVCCVINFPFVFTSLRSEGTNYSQLRNKTLGWTMFC